MLIFPFLFLFLKRNYRWIQQNLPLMYEVNTSAVKGTADIYILECISVAINDFGLIGKTKKK